MGVNGIDWAVSSELQCTECGCVKNTYLKIIGKTSMIDYANKLLEGVRVVTTKYASI